MIAYLSSQGKYTSFSVGDRVLRFRTSHNLVRYERVKVWDRGYIVVDATVKMNPASPRPYTILRARSVNSSEPNRYPAR